MIKCVIQLNWCITCSKRVLCGKGSGYSTRRNNHDFCFVVVKFYFVVSHTFLYNNNNNNNNNNNKILYLDTLSREETLFKGVYIGTSEDRGIVYLLTYFSSGFSHHVGSPV